MNKYAVTVNRPGYLPESGPVEIEGGLTDALGMMTEEIERRARRASPSRCIDNESWIALLEHIKRDQVIISNADDHGESTERGALYSMPDGYTIEAHPVEQVSPKWKLASYRRYDKRIGVHGPLDLYIDYDDVITDAVDEMLPEFLRALNEHFVPPVRFTCPEYHGDDYQEHEGTQEFFRAEGQCPVCARALKEMIIDYCWVGAMS